METTFITIKDKKIEVAANALTLVVYEDAFKGRRFLRDCIEAAENILTTDVSAVSIARMLWAEARTVSKDIPDFCEWVEDFSISDILNARFDVMMPIVKSIFTDNKPGKVTIRERVKQRIRQRQDAVKLG